MNQSILVTYEPAAEEIDIFQEVLNGLAQVRFLQQESESSRSRLLASAEIIVALSFSQNEIHLDEIPLLQNTRFIQLIYAGADKIPFAHIPAGVTIASNAGAFAGPIAEHVLGMALALAKNLVFKNKRLMEGNFDRTGFNRELNGGICGIVGFGGNGRDIAAKMRAMGMQIFGINRSGRTDAPIDFIGTAADLRKVLDASDVLVLAAPLTRATRNLIGKKELNWMKPDAILINVGRGDVVNQKALYEHLKSHPEFKAGIDTWWSEPAEPGPFKPEFPFFDLPNIIGSPHCADHVPGSIPHATRIALENVKRFLQGLDLGGVLNREDYLDSG
jgi:phosphoglycerate dehydrogenase-like enzyme